MALEAGVLRVTLHYGKDLKDCDWFGRQDPYARVRVGNQERRSRVCRDGGRNPVWDETFEFSIINENTLDITLMDEDTLKRDDLIGTATVGLARTRSQGHDIVEAPVSDGKKIQKQLGFIKVSLIFTPNTLARPSATQPYPLPAHQLSMPHQATPSPYAYPFPQQTAYYPMQYCQAPSQPHVPVAPYAAPPAALGWPPASGYGAPSAPSAPPAPSFYYPAVPGAPPAYGVPYGVAPSYRG